MKSKYTPVALGLAILAGAAQASFLWVPLERLVERNPVVIVGKIESIEGTGLFGRRHPGWDVATIRIAKVLKNEASDPRVKTKGVALLAMPNTKESPTPPLRHKKGTSGVWILAPRAGKHYDRRYYYKGHPDQFKPLAAEGNIAAIIARQSKEQAAALRAARENLRRQAENRDAVPIYRVKQFRAALSRTPDDTVDLHRLLYSKVCNRQGTVGYVFLDHRGQVHLATRYHVQGPFREGLAPVATKVGEHSVLMRYGFIDRAGKVVFDPEYDEAHGFSEGLAFVRKGRKYGAVDHRGGLAVAMEYDRVIEPYGFRGGLAQVQKGPRTLLIDKTGRVRARVQTGDRWYLWSEGLFPQHRLSSDYDIVDRKGLTVAKVGPNSVGFEFFDFRRFREGLAAVRRGGQSGRWGFLDRTGRPVIAPSFVMVGTFSEGLVPVVVNAQERYLPWGYADTKGNVVIAPAFHRAGPFSEGLAAVAALAWVENPYKPGAIIHEIRYGYIDRSGAFVIPAWFDSAGPFRNGIARVNDGGVHGFIDRAGRYIWRAADYHVAKE